MMLKEKKKKKEMMNRSMIGEWTELNDTSPSSSFRRGSGGSGEPGQQRHARKNNYNYNNNTKSNIIANGNHHNHNHHNETDNEKQSTQSSYHVTNNLEQRARTHAQIVFPHDSTSQSLALLTSWNRTTVAIIMLLSKSWGKDSRWHIQSTSEFDRQQLCRMVVLADTLLTRLLSTKEHEIDVAIAGMKDDSIDDDDDDDDGNSTTTTPFTTAPFTTITTTTTTTPITSNRGRIISRQQKKLNTEILCSTVALGWSRCDPSLATDAARKAEAILNRLESICTKLERIDDCTTTGRTNNNDNSDVVNAGHYYGGKTKSKSRTLLGFDARDVTPSIKLYNHVLSCWSRSSDPMAEWRAKSLLDRMAGRSSIASGGKECTTTSTAFSQPDTFSYNNMLNLYANRGDAKSAETMLLQMESNVCKGDLRNGGGASADVYSYSIVINAFQKRFTSSGPKGGGDRKDLERAEELLSTLAAKYEQSGFRDTRLRPTNVTFGTIISMYAQADRMARVTPDGEFDGRKTRKWKATMLTRENMEGGNDIGWGAVNAERVLNWMIGLSERERLSKKADVLSLSPSSPTNTIAVDRMELICPNTHNFATVMDAWAKAGKGVEGARRCQALLDRLVSLYDKWDYNELRPIPLVRKYAKSSVYTSSYFCLHVLFPSSSASSSNE